jgi:hypothetical protein
LARAGWLRDEVTVITERPQFILARAGDVRISTAGADEPPHRLRAFQAHRIGESITGTRVTTPPAESGDPGGGARQASTRPQRSPSVPSVENPAVTPTVLPARNPSAIRPWIPQHRGPQRDKVAHDGTEKKRPLAREFAASGAFSQRVAGVGFEPS